MEKSRFDHYNVYLVGTGYGCYAKDYKKILMGETWAPSQKKAISQVKWRLRNEDIPTGLEDREGMGYVVYTWKAERA